MKNKLIAAKLEKNKFIKKFQYQFKFFLILAVSYKRPTAALLSIFGLSVLHLDTSKALAVFCLNIYF